MCLKQRRVNIYDLETQKNFLHPKITLYKKIERITKGLVP